MLLQNNISNVTSYKRQKMCFTLNPTFRKEAIFAIMNRFIPPMSNSSTTLYLRPDEQALFQAVPADVRAGYSFETEEQEFADTEKRLKLRVQFLRLFDPALNDLRDKMQAATTEAELLALIEGADLTSLDERDLFNILFTLGPGAVSQLIRDALVEAKTTADLDGVATFSQMRHLFLESLIASFPSSK